MKKYIQIYLGGIDGRNISIRDIENKLKLFKNEKIDGIIIGWSLEKETYKWIRDYTKKEQIELYLWFQVLSEYSRLKEFSMIVDINGNNIDSMRFDDDEEFSFYCPSHPSTYNNLIKVYEEYFSELDFDGVFLDRIRFPSVTCGCNSLFTCTCDECMKFYRKQNLSKEMIKEIYGSVINGFTSTSPLGIEFYDIGRYRFKDDTIEKYLYLRTELITELVRKLSVYFRSKGLKVGLDLFPPFLSLFVGQDYRSLSNHADFIKPMLYRYTETPAGMDFELKGGIKNLSTDDNYINMLSNFKRIVGYEDNNISTFMKKEIQEIEKISNCDIYIGIEVHTINSLPIISVDQIKEGIDIIEDTNVDGRIASWNMMSASNENILAFLRNKEENNYGTQVGI